MATLDPTRPDTGDERAIAELHEAFERQRRAFLADPYPSLEQRREHLAALAGAVMGHRAQIREAMSADFAVHPELFTDLVEVLGVAGRAAYAMEHLEAWMAPEERYVDPQLYGTGKGLVRPQPKGVIGTIVPWNFPFDLSLGPLVEQLAAGNRVLIKPSEFTPACSEVLRDLVRSTFDRDRVDVVVGGLELAKAFTALRWDHLLYTGNPTVGRLIARAAAEQLVPVTLELGGKCPALIAEDALDAEAVHQVIGTKMIKSGQMCITVDYALVPRAQLGRFVELAQAFVRDAVPAFSRSPDAAGIITERHLDRLVDLVEEARSRGCEVVALDEHADVDRESRRMPLTLVVDPPEDLGLMREEIFGPILPVIPYDTLDDAIAWVNAGERPLALYVFARDEATSEDVLRRTVSGGACVNVCAVHGALASLPFGGIGESGTGRHHGHEGFREFSNPRAVFVRGEGDLAEVFLPPYDERTAAVVEGAFAAAQS